MFGDILAPIMVASIAAAASLSGLLLPGDSLA